MTFSIFLRKELITEMKFFRFQDKGRFFNFICGVNIVGNEKIEAIYLTLINFIKDGSGVALETPWFILVFVSTYPFFYYESSKGKGTKLS